VAAALVANTIWIDSRTRAASPRNGGKLIDTGVALANVRTEGTGSPILMIHGFGAAMDWWDDIAPPLAASHRVIRIDLIGHGGTEAPRSGYSIERQARLAAGVLDALSVDRVTIIGHSMGGEVAVALAEMKPERIEHLILIDSPPSPGTTFTIMMKLYLIPVIGELLSHCESDTSVRRGLAQGFAPNFPVPDKFISDLRQLTYTAFRSAHEDSIAFRTAKPPYERLAAIKPVPPLLAISGSLDAIVPPDHTKLFEQVPGARTAIIEGVGHSPMVENPSKTLALINSFLK
jgi:pimeloyl-ACP methyl ester carboxylesterase